MGKKLGCRARRIERIRAAMPFTEELKAHGKECDATWWARHDSREDPELWYVTPFSVNGRGGEPLEDSNYEVAQRLIEESAGMEIDYRVDLWPGGSINTIIIRADDALAIRMVEELVGCLHNYPILDEEHYAEVQWEHDHPSSTECYSESGDDCSCEVRERKRQVAKHSCLIEFYAAMYSPSIDREENTAPEDIDHNDDTFWCPFCDAYMRFTDDMVSAVEGLVIWREWEEVLQNDREMRRNGQTTLV